MSSTQTQSYLPLVLEGRAADVIALFRGTPKIDDPRLGHVEGASDVAAFVGKVSAWLSEHKARLEAGRTTHTSDRTVAEWQAHLTLNAAPQTIAIAIVGQGAEANALDAIRVYHSMWPLLGHHILRKPLLKLDHRLKISDVVGEYQDGLARGDVEKVMAQFEPDAYFQEPAGPAHQHTGTQELRAFFSSLFHAGGIPLEHCSVTDDGVCCCIEFNAVRFGKDDLEPQAGIAIYERGAKGKLVAARIYDDVDVENRIQVVPNRHRKSRG